MKQVEAPVREIEISRLELEAFDAREQQAVLRVECSKGTYIRQLVEDIAVALGTAAYASSLRRTRTGDFDVEQAVQPGKTGLPATGITAVGSQPVFYFRFGCAIFPSRERSGRKRSEGGSRRARHRRSRQHGPVRLAADGRLLAIYGTADKAGQLRPLVVLA